jgi:hypothetical protein
MSTDTIPVGLRRIPLFADLDENKLREYLQLLRPLSFHQGDCLMTQGEIANPNPGDDLSGATSHHPQFMPTVKRVVRQDYQFCHAASFSSFRW